MVYLSARDEEAALSSPPSSPNKSTNSWKITPIPCTCTILPLHIDNSVFSCYQIWHDVMTLIPSARCKPILPPQGLKAEFFLHFPYLPGSSWTTMSCHFRMDSDAVLRGQHNALRFCLTNQPAMTRSDFEGSFEPRKKKNGLTFHCIGCLIGILIMVNEFYYNLRVTG